MPSVSASLASQPQQSVDFPINSKFVFDKGTAAYILSIELQVMVIVTWRRVLIYPLWYVVSDPFKSPSNALHPFITSSPCIWFVLPRVSHIISSTHHINSWSHPSLSSSSSLSALLSLPLTNTAPYRIISHHIASYLTISHHVMVSWVIPMILASHRYRHFTKSRLFGPRWYRGNRHSR